MLNDGVALLADYLEDRLQVAELTHHIAA